MSGHELTRRALAATLPLAAATAAMAQDKVVASLGAGRLRPTDPRVEWLRALAAIDTHRPRFTWTLQGDPLVRGQRQAAWRIVVATREADAAVGRGDIWDSGRLSGAACRAQPDRDLPLKSQRVYFWSLQVWDASGAASGWMTPEALLTGLMAPGDWRAKWIAAEPDRPVRISQSRNGHVPPETARTLPIFRRVFAVARPVRRAVIAICGLGQYELTINGEAVTDSLLNPGWSDYRRTVLYNSYEVTSHLRAGDNALGVMLGNGMYNVENVKDRYKKHNTSFGQPKLIAQLRIEYEDGGEDILVSDASWSRRDGPITFSSIYGGEDHDARRDPPGWRMAYAPTQDWLPALEVGAPQGRLKAQGAVPIAVDRILPTVKVTEPKPGVFVYDFGENAACRPVLKVKGQAGATVRLSPSEVLGADGMIAPRSTGARPGLDNYYAYTLRGGGEESWTPRFTYCGSRYLQVTGAAPADRAPAGTPAIVELHNEFIHAGVDQVGDFESSQTLLVQIHRLIKQAALSNTVSVFTDCPHREKLGWLEQDQLNAQTLLYVEDAITIYEKMVADIVDAQLPDGQIPEIAPEFVVFNDQDSIYRDSPEWGGAVVLGAWAAYRFNGDARILAVGYPAMRRYADHLERKRVRGIVDYGLGDWLDIGPRKGGGVSQLTTQGLTGTATYFEMLTALVRISQILGRPPAEAEDFRRRAADVKAAFNARFFHPDTGGYDTGSQTANAMPLAVGLVPRGREAEVMAHLVADIRSRADHVTAGDVGFHYVVQALMDHGRPEVLHAMLSRTDAPSYGAQIAAGATALTENWDPARGGSQDHFMLGHAEAWLFAGLGGVRLDFAAAGPAITVAPQMVPGVDSARVAYRSVLGEVASAWRRQGGGAVVEIEVPAGALATVRLPGLVRESGRPAKAARGVLSAREIAGITELVVGSGRYAFEVAKA